jgi:hypothetical protein
MFKTTYYKLQRGVPRDNCAGGSGTVNKNQFFLVVALLLVTGSLFISGCTSPVSCPQCASSSLEIVGNYTNQTTGHDMLLCNCNNCGYVFEVEK